MHESNTELRFCSALANYYGKYLLNLSIAINPVAIARHKRPWGQAGKCNETWEQIQIPAFLSDGVALYPCRMRDVAVGKGRAVFGVPPSQH